MEVVKGSRITWAITIRFNKKKQATKEDYQKVLSHIVKYKEVTLRDFIYEKNSMDEGYHFHGVIEIDKGFLRKKLMLDGYSIKLDEIYNIDGWRQYIRKAEKVNIMIKPEYKPNNDDLEDLDQYIRSVKPEFGDEMNTPEYSPDMNSAEPEYNRSLFKLRDEFRQKLVF